MVETFVRQPLLLHSPMHAVLLINQSVESVNF